MNENLFSEYGEFLGTLPAECVDDCSMPGCDASDPVAYWRKRLDFQVPRELAVRYLRDFGAWDDLATVEDATLANRVLWIACGDIRENGEWLGLIH